MTAGLYLRVSTELQNKQGYSLLEQEATGISWAETMGYNHIIYKDVESGGEVTREEFQRMISDIENGKIGIVWLRNFDRMARDGLISSQFKNIIQHYGIPLYENTEHFQLDTPEGNLMYGVRAIIAEYDKDTILARMERGRTYKFLNGGKHIHDMYGYDYVRDPKTGKGMYPVNKTEVKIIHEIMGRIIRDESYNSIATDLNKRRIPSPRNGKWAVETLARIASHKIYTGYYDHKDKTNIESYLYEPIISWDYHLEVMDHVKRAVSRRTTDNIKHNNHLCSGLFRCWYCGGLFYFAPEASEKNKKEYYYENYKGFHKKGCKRIAKQQAADEKSLDLWVENEISKFFKDKDTIEKIFISKKTKMENQEGKYQDQIDSLNSELKRLKQKKMKNIELNNSLSEEEGVGEDEDVMNEIKRLVIREKEVKKEIQDLKISIASKDEEIEKMLYELMISTENDYLNSTTFGKRKKLFYYIKDAYIKDKDIFIEWITGKKSEIKEYRRHFESRKWKEMLQDINAVKEIIYAPAPEMSPDDIPQTQEEIREFLKEAQATYHLIWGMKFYSYKEGIEEVLKNDSSEE